MSHTPRYDVEDRPPIGIWVSLSFQHVFAMFGATILVPLLTGLDPAIALFSSGIGTLLYIMVTQAKVPAYLGSSFAFIPSIIAVSAAFGIEYALGAGFVVGLFYVAVAGIIRAFGRSWLDHILPPVVIGAIIMVIGLNLAPVAMNMSMYPYADPELGYQWHFFLTAAVTLGIGIICSIFLKGFFTVVPVLIAIIGGYLFALVFGFAFPELALIDLSSVAEASWFGLPEFTSPRFGLIPIITFLLVSLATIAEHLGDTLVMGTVAGRDFYKEPGVHRTLVGDGIATSVASLFGGPPNTTYGENIGVMAISRVYSVPVIGGAAVIAVVLSFFSKFGALIQTIPGPVMGGISTMLFGIIASAGIRTVVESGVDYAHKRNLVLTSIILVIGIGGGRLFLPLPFLEGVDFDLSGVALATLVGIIANLLIPHDVIDPEDEDEHILTPEQRRL
ncbi:uracil-xanthine permease family protein [Spirochaeta africana]|uniref:Uracil-xanthine permease n=1 Tax=Spirochaeta africana (strain ATCC 700263 / DSM 8902 / Z-7692) TaxID=889378 RepID=H9UIQ7_SPIAZ|nr:solute carrier family 23 protein [Spirochaeta africana]AFG37400.1 uracil-xanthine permease [Spirochaeta africana DSM 8902]